MTIRKTRATTLSAAALSAAALSLVAAPALVVTTTVTAQPAAAQAAQTAPAEQTEQAGQDYSAAQLDAFVAAFLQVTELRAVYTDRLQQAADEDAQQAIVEEGNAAIVDAIDRVDGMDLDLYTAILEDAGTDSNLDARLTRRLQDAMQG